MQKQALSDHVALRTASGRPQGTARDNGSFTAVSR